ncbi:BREX-1 system adenine-specific DNA-methyltransferase PglX [Salipiger marinus]|uniref:site-specific DNA-methyltransferase (adenine-specific) n=1 Tax=Salipiger marinus TaxID=555512 RepID=A0A1G8UCN1_9RHOB|nr:BREX-1 system adenine-specific DNA-methyltransferase PglX [Salipiger marinus]SDJ51513.1 Type II restriction/modification system, DNA methylase subunit YeeA [Salipiger marinus]
MDTNRLKTFAQRTRIDLMGQVARKLDAVLAPESDARREAPEAIRTLEGRIREIGRQGVIEQVAYTWFNRFTALRYMDVNGYLTPMVVSPAVDRTRPEILDQAAAGAIPEHVRAPVATRIRGLLEGRAPSREPQVEAYRLLLVAACNDLNRVMPFLFEAIADYTELLMPNEFLAADGWVSRMREVMTEEACQDVEIIGWLYQFYISEKKDQVFAGLKKNQKITAENIPAATQLFTPHWIVRYLVENSLGRLWLLNRPGSRLAERMEYYIAPEEPETDFLRVSGPQEIRICDPACGSGHMLTYAFDLLYAIYEEEGFPSAEIPGLILTHNLTGIEIDDRAGALAAFALAMKAAAKLGRRRFLRMEVKPDVVVLENVTFTPAEMQDVAAVVGRDLFTDELRTTLMQFEQAKNFGSLIVPVLRDPAETLRVVEARDFGSDLLLKGVRDRVVAVLRMAEALAPRYHVVVANPPYMGGKGMNGALGEFAKKNYPEGKSDLFAAFIQRGESLLKRSGFNAMVTMESWMFLSSFEEFRTRFLVTVTINSMVHMPYLGKGGTSMGINFGTVAFVAAMVRRPDFRGEYCSVRYFETDDSGVPNHFPPQNERRSKASTSDFERIPGNPIAFWLSETAFNSFSDPSSLLSTKCRIREGINTGDNDRFLRLWTEVSQRNFVRESSTDSRNAKWFAHRKGGDYRKWYGNNEYVLNWANQGAEIHNFHNLPLDFNGAPMRGKSFFFKRALAWSRISSGKFSIRYYDAGQTYDSTAPSIFEAGKDEAVVLAFLNSPITAGLLEALSPTLDYRLTNLGRLPLLLSQSTAEGQAVAQNTRVLVKGSRSDWDSYETSWDFTTLPLLSPDHRSGTLEATYARLRAHWAGMTAEMKRLEEENNRIFIDAYGLQDELTPEVPIEEITLTCNPAYRYGVKGTEEEREARLLADTMKELISYAIGCMFGRYSLDAPGLILANQGDTAQTYLDRIPKPTFAPDRDNVIPLFEEDWFADDAYQRFREFLSVTFGADRLVENLEFMRAALGKEVRTYLAKDFYADHVQRYKKRPIYWLVSSPKGAFQALIYMHRYSPDTLNITLNDYVRGLRDRLEAALRAAKATEISPDATAAEKNRAKRDIDRFTKQIAEVTEWERDTLYPLAVERIRIDLDDGVKRNYPKFPGVLRPVKGLEDEDA